jgi:hypothetical protein
MKGKYGIYKLSILKWRQENLLEYQAYQRNYQQERYATYHGETKKQQMRNYYQYNKECKRLRFILL